MQFFLSSVYTKYTRSTEIISIYQYNQHWSGSNPVCVMTFITLFQGGVLVCCYLDSLSHLLVSLHDKQRLLVTQYCSSRTQWLTASGILL